MSKPEWQPRCEALAAELRAACAAACAPDEVRAEDRTGTMLAEEEDPYVAPFYPIGQIYHFRIRVRRTHLLFGRRWLPVRYWSTLVRFGMEEMFDAPWWAKDKGLWCVVHGAGLDGPVRAIMARFAFAHGLRLDFAGTAKDP